MKLDVQSGVGEGLLIIREGSCFRVEYLDKTLYSLGRSEAVDITLRSTGVSRHHASIKYEDGKYWIIDGDLGGNMSTNGLTINGEQKYAHSLESGDIILFFFDVSAMFLDRQNIIDDTLTDSGLFLGLISFIAGNKKAISKNGNLTPEEDLTSIVKRVEILDDLTKLPNRRVLLEKLEHSIFLQEKLSDQYKFAVLFIDLDKFKLINDSLGHFAGDALLVEVSKRMQASLRSKDLVARLAGDEFAVLVSEVHDLEEAVAVAKRVSTHLETPILIDDNEIFPSASIGLVLSSSAYTSPEAILKDADTAMYQAKANGRGRIEVFDETMREKAATQLKLDAELRRAVQAKEFVLHYQPVVGLKTRDIAGFEALIRWQHPERGLLGPHEFIQSLEDKRLIQQVNKWILNEVCQQLSDWRPLIRDKSDFSISVNVSSSQLLSNEFVDMIQSLIKQYRLPARFLKLELTENIIMDDSQFSLLILERLKKIGIEIYVDDFGTGYSSLSYLHQFPISALKIDRSFIAEIDSKADGSIGFSISQSIIGLAHNLGVKVVAEGIENVRHLIYLQASQCDYGQGYLFSKPMAAAQATSLLQTGLEWRWKC